MAGHIDKWCLENCDPHLFRDLDKVSVSTESYLLVSYLCIIIMLWFQVDTEVCEQTFSWLSRYGKMTRRMNRSTFLFFLLYMCDLHNERELKKLLRGHYM